MTESRNTRSKKMQRFRLGLLAALLGFMLGAPSVVSAHTASNYFTTGKWSADPNYYIGSLPGDSAGSTTAIDKGDEPWDINTGTWLDFHKGGTDSGVQYLTGCTTGYGTRPVWITGVSISGLANEYTCYSGSTITRSVITIDSTRSNWYQGTSTSVPSGDVDLISVMVHEFGHAGGFVGHWDGVGEDCTGSDRETMCLGTPTGTSYKRSIQLHENHTFDSAY